MRVLTWNVPSLDRVYHCQTAEALGVATWSQVIYSVTSTVVAIVSVVCVIMLAEYVSLRVIDSKSIPSFIWFSNWYFASSLVIVAVV